MLDAVSIPMLALGCGPFLDEDGTTIMLLLLLLVKPLAYFAFIQAFRYRVSRPIPMRFRQAIWLTLFRAGLGFLLTGAGVVVFAMLGENTASLLSSWGYLYVARMFAWWIVGYYGAGVRGRRLAGWIISGVLINAAFDIALVVGLFAGWAPPAVIVGLIATFIAILHIVGRRPSLRIRFADASTCRGCQYDLTGNLSGVCPECGRAVVELTGPAVAEAA